MALATLASLGGCASPVNLYTAQRYFDAGMAAEVAGRYQLAHDNYYRAYVNTELARADEQKKGLVMYNLARMKASLCLKSDAEALFLKSIAAEENARAQNGGWYSARLAETGRFYLGFAEPSKAIPFFERASSRFVDSKLEQTHPVEMADFWEEYAEALKQIDSKNKANELLARADLLRKNNPGKTATYTPYRYGKSCSPSGR
jgi:tetratricopeptide (TPR) repeat protein